MIAEKTKQNKTKNWLDQLFPTIKGNQYAEYGVGGKHNRKFSSYFMCIQVTV